MLHGKKVVVVLPAYNAAATLKTTYSEIPKEIVDEIVLVDDGSRDDTVQIAKELGIRVEVHAKNLGYGGNQKTCYRIALDLGADIIVMLHPDYQYSPRLLTAMAAMIVSGHYDLVLASRILGGGALTGGMPLYKYFFNRCLTAFQNVLLGTKLSEFHTGYRAYSRKVLEALPLSEFSNNFVFDNQVLASAVRQGFTLGEISCPTRYFPEASSISFSRSVVYGIGVLRTSFQYNRWTNETAPRSSLP
jgi:glycosyltransferase involved in cell wall biosynthesis